MYMQVQGGRYINLFVTLCYFDSDSSLLLKILTESVWELLRRMKVPHNIFSAISLQKSSYQTNWQLESYIKESMTDCSLWSPEKCCHSSFHFLEIIDIIDMRI